MSKLEIEKEDDDRASSKNIEIFENVFYTINQMLIGVTTCYMTWYCFKIGFDALISYHALFLTIGVSKKL